MAPYPPPALCECCKQPPNRKAFAVDHDHKTGAFRGYLCDRCNVGIGMLQDSLDGVLMAVEYFLTISSKRK